MGNTTHEGSTLQAGAAQVDISPKMGISISGNITIFRPAQYVQDPIYARALCLESGDCRLCLLSLDLLTVTREWVEEIRRRVSDEFGFEPGAIMVHDTQNHSSPALGHFNDRKRLPPELWWVKGGDPRYNEFAVERIVKAVRRALGKMEPAVIGAASGIDGRWAFNRRYVMRDGTVRMLSGCDPMLLHAEGPADPEVGVVCVNTEDLRILSMLLHHTCHPVSGLPRLSISADWPGAWCDGVREAYGAQIVPLVINGCCGNIRPSNPLDPNMVTDHRLMGRGLTQTTEEILKGLTYEHQVKLDWKSRHLSIPIRELPAEDVENARKLLEEHPEPIYLNEAHTRLDRPWMQAVSCLDQHELRLQNPAFDYDYEIQVIRLGETALVAIPGEPFVEGQLEIKLRSPAYPTYVVHHCHSYVGYVPTRAAHGRVGGHETTPHTARLCVGALEMIVDNAVELLHEVFD